MTTSTATIQEWIDDRPEGTTHMIVVCDTFDWDDYPVYFPAKDYHWAVSASLTLQDVIQHYSGNNMQKVMEVYSFTGKHSIADQLKEFRAHHLD